MKNLLNKYQKLNAFEIARVNKTEIVYENLGQLLGYVHNGRSKAIVINENLEWYKREFMCGNLIYNSLKYENKNLIWFKDRPDYVFSQYEKEGNEFSARLQLDKIGNITSLTQLCKMRGMSDREITEFIEKIKHFSGFTAEELQNNSKNVLKMFITNAFEQQNLA